MDTIQDLLGKYSPKEPPEILAIKEYIRQRFNADSHVGQQGDSLVISVASGSLANTLRFHITELQAAAQTDKRIVLRIS
jgi:hypothetical protein